jgi:hypothetical protein
MGGESQTASNLQSDQSLSAFGVLVQEEAL